MQQQRKYVVNEPHGDGRPTTRHQFPDAASLNHYLELQADVAEVFGMVREFTVETKEVGPDGRI